MRDKLIELLSENVVDFCHVVMVAGNCKISAVTLEADKFADHLIANGVTVQQWIPVDEAKPKLIPNAAGTAYSDAVNCLTSGRKVITAIWDGTDFVGDAEFWEAEDETITHWCPVLLPLPAEVDNEHR